MRTTVNISQDIKSYVQRLKNLGERASVSSVMDDAIAIALPILNDRLPRENESRKDFLLRRISEIDYLPDLKASIITKSILVGELAKLQLEAYSEGYVSKLKTINL